MTIKFCKKCGCDTERYHRVNAQGEPRVGPCKECHKRYYKDNSSRIIPKIAKHYAENTERILQQRKTRYKTDSARILEKNKAYASANAGKIACQRKGFYRDNADRLLAELKTRRAENPERTHFISKKWRDTHAELSRSRVRDYRRRNPHVIRALNMKRVARKLHATPAWADQTAITAVYALAEKMTKDTGVKYHVDHIIPLCSRIVQGLHCEHNLQILSASENISKGNRHWPDMP